MDKGNVISLKKELALIIITAIITSLITVLASGLLWNYQHKITKSEKLLENQYQLLEDFTQLDFEVAFLHERIYWNKFYWGLSSLVDPNAEDAKEFFRMEEEYRNDYSKKISEIQAILRLLPLYYENFDLVKVVEYNSYLDRGFGFNLDSFKEEYERLLLINKDTDVAIDKLKMIFYNNYQSHLSNKSAEITIEMYKNLGND